MSETSPRPWYKKTKNRAIVVAAVVTLLAAVLAPLIAHWLGETDFEMSISPMSGTVQQGGDIMATVTARRVRRYSHRVTLSASPSVSDVRVAFAEATGPLKPAFTTNLTIRVGDSVPVGRHEIQITAMGEDGTSHEVRYYLTVLPAPPTATPVATATPEPTATAPPTDTPPPTAVPSPTDTATLAVATLTPTDTPTKAPTEAATPSEALAAWEVYSDGRSPIELSAAPGRFGEAVEITFELVERGYVGLSRAVEPGALSDKAGIAFFYQAAGAPQTIELKAIDGRGATYGRQLDPEPTGEGQWKVLAVPFEVLACWPDTGCQAPERVRPEEIQRLDFAVANKPDRGDQPGQGVVRLSDITSFTHPAGPDDLNHMGNLVVWAPYVAEGATLELSAAPGRTEGQALQMAFDLPGEGWAVVSRVLPAGILVDSRGLSYAYRYEGHPQTLEVKLILEPGAGGATFGLLQNLTPAAGEWRAAEALWADMACFEGTGCQPGDAVDLGVVWRVEFAVSSKGERGNAPGQGVLLLDELRVLR